MSDLRKDILQAGDQSQGLMEYAKRIIKSLEELNALVRQVSARIENVPSCNDNSEERKDDIR